jgi:tripartite-type tricarboxylate transporter receptor subunit TctC
VKDVPCGAVAVGRRLTEKTKAILLGNPSSSSAERLPERRFQRLQCLHPSFEAAMNDTKRLALSAAFIVLSAFPLSRTAPAAEAWPQRTVKFIVPLGPASGADVTARVLADHLSRRWGQAVVVENRPGADGIVGLTAFLGSSDDHVLLFTATGSFTAYPFLHEKLPYNLDQLAPIARVTNTVIAVTVPTSLKINSLAELMTLVRSQPGRYHWASITGATDLVFSGFLKSAGLSMVRVPYRESVLAVNDLSEGRIELFLSALATVLPQVTGGKIRMLALTNHERAPVVPEVPTVREAGYPALQFDGLVGLFATARMPVELRERIAGDVRAAIADPAVAGTVAATGQIVSPGSPAEFARAIEEQLTAFTAIAKSLDRQPGR